jgi:glycosyltransferase involved in cell wall biosynthesis
MIVHANLCEYGSALRKLPIVWLARMLGAHAVIHLHGAEMKTMFDRLPNLLRQIFRQGMLRADRIVVLGRSWEDFLCRDVGVDRERIVIIPNAVPIPSSMRSVQPGTRCRLLFLGRLEERKGADRFIQALSSPQLAGLDYEAVMAGDGQLDLYRAMADALSLTGRVNFTGWLDRDTVANLMRTSDVLVLPSLNEGLPMAILEGMANGLAIVTTPVGAIADAIRDGDTGLLVPPGDTPLLASALGRVIRDPELRLRLGRNAREFAQTDFDVARYGERFVRLYAQVLGGRAAEPKTRRR